MVKVGIRECVGQVVRLVVGHQPVCHGLDLLGCVAEEDPAGLGDIHGIAINLRRLHSVGPRRLRGARPGLLVQ